MGNKKMKIEQLGIFIFGVSAIFLVGLDPANPLQRWGFVCGLISQPCWFFFAIRTKAWGILGLSFLYTASWFNGVINNFF